MRVRGAPRPLQQAGCSNPHRRHGALVLCSAGTFGTRCCMLVRCLVRAVSADSGPPVPNAGKPGAPIDVHHAVLRTGARSGRLSAPMRRDALADARLGLA